MGAHPYGKRMLSHRLTGAASSGRTRVSPAETSAQVWAALWADEDGVSAIILGLSLSAILGFAGLAVDAGLWYNDKRTLQGVADLAAWTAAQTYGTEVQNGTASATASTDGQNAAQALAAANNVPTGANGVTVTVTPTVTASSATFTVLVQKSENLFFSSRYLHSVTVASQAAAQYSTTTTGSGSPGCILALNNLEISHGAKVTAGSVATTGCGVDVNGAASNALTIDNGAQFTVDSLNVVGGTSTANGSHITVNDGSAYNVQSGGTATADPYAGITLANAESAAPGPACTSGTGTTASGNTSNPGTVSPGYYCGGLAISGNVTLSPGVYVINGGSFSVGDGATATATSGVTIVLTGNANVDINSGGKLDITAPTTGATAGLVFYSDPANSGTMNFSDGSRVNANGAYYFPGATVYFASGSDSSSTAVDNCAQLVGYNITLAPGGSYTLVDQNCPTYGVKQIGGTVTKVSMKMVQ